MYNVEEYGKSRMYRCVWVCVCEREAERERERERRESAGKLEIAVIRVVPFGSFF